MTVDLGLLIGLISIAIALFFGLFFGLAGLRSSIVTELSTIKETVIAIRGTAEKTWDLVVTRFGVSSGTVVRELENLGKVKITAEPGVKETVYLVEIEKPILKEGLLIRGGKQSELVVREKGLFEREGAVNVFSPRRMTYRIPSIDPKTCTEFITFFLKWLNSTYVESLKEIEKFEEPILT